MTRKAITTTKTNARRSPSHSPEAHQQAEHDFRAILAAALEQPGMISGAYRAFHRFSMGNQVLAAMQLMGRGLALSPLASYRAWQDKGRQVKKGERAISLFMPVTIKGERKNDETGEAEAYSFQRFALRPNWFAYDQTEGEDFAPELKTPDWDAARALQALQVEEVPFDMLGGNVQGYASGRTIAINPMAWLKHKTRFHELAHVVLGHTDQGATMSDSERTPPALAEVEAEGVAFLLCTLLELPGRDESRGYIQSWLSQAGAEVPERSAQRIFSVAQKILAAGQAPAEAEPTDS